MIHPYEPDRALADLDCLALRERVRELEEALRPYVEQAAPHEELFNAEDYWNFQRATAALADHREGQDGD